MCAFILSNAGSRSAILDLSSPRNRDAEDRPGDEPAPILEANVYANGVRDKKMVPPARFQRATFRLGGGRSMQLSYGSLTGILIRVQTRFKEDSYQPPRITQPEPPYSSR